MGVFLGEIDIMMSLDGDLAVDGTGDLKLTEGFDWLVREINKRVRTINPEWKGHETLGADIETFAGRANTKEVADEISRRITDSVSSWGLDSPGAIQARVVPTGPSSVNVFIFIDLMGIRYNLTRVIFDFDNGVVQPVTDPEAYTTTIVEDDSTFDPAVHSVPDNKYLKRIYGTGIV